MHKQLHCSVFAGYLLWTWIVKNPLQLSSVIKPPGSHRRGRTRRAPELSNDYPIGPSGVELANIQAHAVDSQRIGWFVLLQWSLNINFTPQERTVTCGTNEWKIRDRGEKGWWPSGYEICIARSELSKACLLTIRNHTYQDKVSTPHYHYFLVEEPAFVNKFAKARGWYRKCCVIFGKDLRNIPLPRDTSPRFFVLFRIRFFPPAGKNWGPPSHT